MKQIILTKEAPAPIGAYSQAVKYNGMLYISGQLAIDPHTGKLMFDGIKKGDSSYNGKHRKHIA